MTQKEFENRAIEVSQKEFEAINIVYMASDLDKDEFCKMWCKMNANRIKTYKAEKKAEQEMADLKFELSNVLINRYSYDQSLEIADSFFSKTQKKIIAKAGIDLEDKKAIPYLASDGIIHYIHKMKTVGTILFEIREFIAA